MNEPLWVDKPDALAIHDQLLSAHGGLPGVRDNALLESALARPRQHLAYDEGADLIDLAAVYVAGIVQNHPFLDGNKRTGFVAGILFLEINGHRLTATEPDAAQAVLDVAAGTLDEVGFAAFLHANTKGK